MRIALIAFFLFLGFTGSAQRDSIQSDTTYLSLLDVVKMTLAYHPVVKQANLLDENAKAVMREARGTLDPKLEADYSLKEFKETEYFNLLNTSLKVPTWIGIDPKVEFYQYRGEFVDRSDFISSTTDNQQVAVGFSVPIGKG